MVLQALVIFPNNTLVSLKAALAYYDCKIRGLVVPYSLLAR